MEWFTRYGTRHEGRVHDADEAKGTAKYTYQDHCQRCGGAGGSDMWKFTGWKCYDCGGSGLGYIRTERLYSAARLAKLQLAQAKRDAKRKAACEAAEQARLAVVAVARREFAEAHVELMAGLERYSGADTFLAEMVSRLDLFGSLTEGQIAAAQKGIAKQQAREGSQFVGTVGERREFTITIEVIIALPALAYGFAAASIHLCRDEQGNRIVYKGTGFIGGKGDKVRVKATVAGHEVYRDEHQTKISRPKVLENLNQLFEEAAQ